MILLLIINFLFGQPISRIHYSLVKTNKEVSIFGGNDIFDNLYNDLWIFDLTNKTWKNYSTPLTRRTYTNMWKNGNDIYLWSGKDEVLCADDLWLLRDGSFQEVGFEINCPHERYASTIWEYNNKIYAFGGIYVDKQFLNNDLWYYEMNENDWELLSGENARNAIFYNTDIPASRGFTSNWIIDDNLYMYGGYNIIKLQDFWNFNITKNAWNLISESNNIKNQSDSCSFIDDSRNLYIFKDYSQIWIYNQNWTFYDNDVNCILHTFRHENSIYTFNGSFHMIKLFEIFIEDDDDNDDTINDDDDTTINGNDDLTPFIIIGVISIVVVLLICFAICSIVIIMYFLIKQTKFRKLKDIDLILEEQRMINSEIKFEINKELFKIPYSSIKIIKKIGAGGSNSVIFLCGWRHKEVVLKLFKIIEWKSNNRFKEFEDELNIIASIHHPNIINFYGATFDQNRCGIVIEFCKHGDIKDFLTNYKEQNKKSYNLNEKIRILFETSNAMNYLHNLKPPVIHRDLKCENILIDRNFEAKVMDFGISKIVKDQDESKTMHIGTGYYMAPELVSEDGNCKYNEKCDVFSFAIVIYCVLSENFKPYKTNFNVEMRVARDPNFRPPLNSLNAPKWIKNLMQNLWKNNPSERYSFEEILEIIKNKKCLFTM